jgi:hypothetical protein
MEHERGKVDSSCVKEELSEPFVKNFEADYRSFVIIRCEIYLFSYHIGGL